MLKHYLKIKDKDFCITALELYLKLHKRKDIWWDAATDKDEDAKEQFNRGTWSVRRKKHQRFWRIDITAGIVREDIQAGILIRQLDGLGDKDPGPATALHRIVRGEFSDKPFNQEQLDLLNKLKGKKINGCDGSPLRHRPASIRQCLLAKGKRFGLPPKLDASFHDAVLRVSIWRKYSADTVIVDNEAASA
jgi:hypothetical protein